MTQTQAQAASSSVPSTPAMDPSPAWRNPYVWLVVGGPLAVVLASVVTVWLAVSIPDPPITTSASNPGAAVKSDPMLPALQGRNHAASSAGAGPTGR